MALRKRTIRKLSSDLAMKGEMLEHSLLPWLRDPWAATHVVAANGRPVLTTGGYSDNSSHENEINAAFILLACNNHDALLEAVKLASEVLWANGLNAVARKMDVVVAKAERGGRK